MTKFEWERQLKKGISGLPKTEQQRVLDYYDELFSDKIDAGSREEEIVAEFGNPYDVANKILVDFYNDGKSNSEADEYVFSDTEKMDVDVRPTHKEYSQAASTDRMAEKTRNKKSSRSAKSANGLIALLCVLLFFVIGACFGKWHPAWMVFLLLPVATSLVDAIEKRNWKLFGYPLFVVFLYLVLGFYGHLWHPMWVLFVTIPVYYALGDYIFKSTSQDRQQTYTDEKRTASRGDSDYTERTKERRERTEQRRTQSSAANIIAGILLTCVLVWVMIVVWSVVIGLFVAGIGMIVGGVAAIVAAIFVLVADLSAGIALLGASLVVLGLGLVFTFGMSGVFKLCARMCKEFGNTIHSCFSPKE